MCTLIAFITNVAGGIACVLSLSSYVAGRKVLSKNKQLYLIGLICLKVKKTTMYPCRPQPTFRYPFTI